MYQWFIQQGAKEGQKIMEEKTAKAQNICVFNILNLKHGMS